MLISKQTLKYRKGKNLLKEYPVCVTPKCHEIRVWVPYCCSVVVAQSRNKDSRYLDCFDSWASSATKRSLSSRSMTASIRSKLNTESNHWRGCLKREHWLIKRKGKKMELYDTEAKLSNISNYVLSPYFCKYGIFSERKGKETPKCDRSG